MWTSDTFVFWQHVKSNVYFSSKIEVGLVTNLSNPSTRKTDNENHEVEGWGKFRPRKVLTWIGFASNKNQEFLLCMCVSTYLCRYITEVILLFNFLVFVLYLQFYCFFSFFLYPFTQCSFFIFGRDLI